VVVWQLASFLAMDIDVTGGNPPCGDAALHPQHLVKAVISSVPVSMGSCSLKVTFYTVSAKWNGRRAEYNDS
jgi:hypothetical protein